MIRLSKAVSDAYFDISQGEQLTRFVCDMVRGIKKKAESAQAAGNSSFSGEYFLNPELFDLDARPVEDAASNMNESLLNFQMLVLVGTRYQEYGRQWLEAVDAIEGDGVGGRMLRIDAVDPKSNGIYEAGLRAADANAAPTLEFATVHVTGGTVYADTIWTQVLKINTLEKDPIIWVRQPEAVVPSTVPGTSGVHTGIGNFFDLVGAYGTSVGACISAVSAFVAAVTALKATSDPGATVSAADAVLALEAPTIAAFEAVEAAIFVIEQLDRQFDHDNMIVSVLVQHELDTLVQYFLHRDSADSSNRIVEAMQGKGRKPFQFTNVLEMGKMRDKHLNSNYVRSGGSPAGSMTGGGGDAGDKIAQAFYDHNAMMEYWAQLGWQAAQKVNKNNPYVRELEQKLRDVGLEEIVTAHDKAVDNMLNTELNISPPNIVDLDLSPPPKDLP